MSEPQGNLQYGSGLFRTLTVICGWDEDEARSGVARWLQCPAAFRPPFQFVDPREEQPSSRKPAVSLSPEQMAVVRARYAHGESQTALAREFGVSQPYVSPLNHAAGESTGAGWQSCVNRRSRVTVGASLAPRAVLGSYTASPSRVGPSPFLLIERGPERRTSNPPPRPSSIPTPTSG